jgi:ribosomal protein L7/L12
MSKDKLVVKNNQEQNSVGFGLLELVIIGALISAAFIFVGIVRGVMFQAQTETVEPRFKQKPAALDWNALADAELQSHLPQMKIEAIKRYRELTGAGLQEAKAAIEYAIVHPEQLAQKGHVSRIVDTDGAGVRDLIAAGRIAEAVKIYAAFMGVDEFTARNAIAQLQRADSAAIRLSDEGIEQIRATLATGNKIEAIKQYREQTGVGLKEAKDAVERIERDDSP